MSRILAALAVLWLVAGGAALAQGFSALARVDAGQSRIADTSVGVEIGLGLSQGVPYRLFTLDGPPRLVMDFREVDWTGLDAEVFRGDSRIGPVLFGTYVPGWSRMVVELGQPMAVQTAEMAIDDLSGAAQLTVVLVPASDADFAAGVGVPYDPLWDLPQPAAVAEPRVRAPDAPLVVVLDPGHGGVDPGAEQGGQSEKSLMLQFALELREVLLRSDGFDVVLTRGDDRFVSLERRVATAHQAGADVFLSLHADALAEGLAHGATVHVLSREASDVASAKLAERHDRDDLLAGADLSSADDQVTDVLLDLARQETQPRTEALARALVDALTQTGGPMNRRPLRSAAFSVLKAADIPSVLVEIGFMSSPRDFENLQDPVWRLRMAEGIRNGLQEWRATDLALRPLVRQ